MLNKLRNSSKNSFTKIILGTLLTLLILSFAIWGTEDLVGISKRQNTVASVGKIDISAREFLGLYSRQTEEIRKLLGASLDIEKGRQFGYVDRALSSLVNRALFNNEAQDLGLSVSDINVKDRIIKDDAFKDDLGQFSELIFRRLISESGYSEDTYVQGTRQDLARDQMVETIRSNFILPKIILKNIGEYNLEERSINYLTLKSADQKIIPPKNDEIQNYFKENKEKFQTDEFRSVETLLLDANDFARNTTVVEDEVKLLYEERKDSLIKPERRYLNQILVQDENLAKKIYTSLTKKSDFEKIATNMANQKKEDIDLGWNTKDELPDAIVDDVFKLKDKSISKPLETAFGWHIIKVLEIEERTELTYLNVKNQLENELLLEKGRDAVFDLQDEIEDFLSSGDSLKEISEKLEVKLISSESINKDGFNIDGSKNKDYNDTRILRSVFNQKENEEGNLIDIDNDNGLAISIVNTIIKPREMTFEEAKESVILELKNKKKFKKASELAKRIKVDLDNSKKIETVAKKYKLEVRGVSSFTRIKPDDTELPLPLISKLFETLPPEAIIHTNGIQEILIAQTAEIKSSFNKNKEDMLSFKNRIEDDMSVDLLAQFSEVLRQKYKISINDEVINQLN